jgi:hypothetical protein
MAGPFEKLHQSIIQGLNWMKQHPDGPLHYETAVEYFIAIYEIWLQLNYLEKA